MPDQQPSQRRPEAGRNQKDNTKRAAVDAPQASESEDIRSKPFKEAIGSVENLA